jgi:hypothetical protein
MEPLTISATFVKAYLQLKGVKKRRVPTQEELKEATAWVNEKMTHATPIVLKQRYRENARVLRTYGYYNFYRSGKYILIISQCGVAMMVYGVGSLSWVEGDIGRPPTLQGKLKIGMKGLEPPSDTDLIPSPQADD